MAIRERKHIKENFKKGKYPTEEHFTDLIDSYLHLSDDLLPIDRVDGLPEEINKKYDKEAGAELEGRVSDAEKRIDGCDVEISVIQDTLGQMDSLVMHKNVAELENPEAGRMIVWLRAIVPVFESGNERPPFSLVFNIEGKAKGSEQPIRTMVTTSIDTTEADGSNQSLRTIFSPDETSTIDYGLPLKDAILIMDREGRAGLYLDYPSVVTIRAEAYTSCREEWNDPYGTDLIENIEAVESWDAIEIDLLDTLTLTGGDAASTPQYRCLTRHLDKQDGRLYSAEKRLDDHDADILAIRDKDARQENRLDSAEEWLDVHQERLDSAEERLGQHDGDISTINTTLGKMDSLVMHKNVAHFNNADLKCMIVWLRDIVPIFETGGSGAHYAYLVFNIGGNGMSNREPIDTKICTYIYPTDDGTGTGTQRTYFHKSFTSTMDYGLPLDEAVLFMTRDGRAGLYLDYPTSSAAIRVEAYSSRVMDWNEPYGTDLVERIEIVHSFEDAPLDIFHSLPITEGNATTQPSYRCLPGHLADHDNRMDTAEGRLDDHDMVLENHEVRINTNVGDIEELWTKNQEYDGYHENHTIDISRLSAKDNQHDQRLDDVDSRLDSHDGRLDRAEEKLFSHDSVLSTGGEGTALLSDDGTYKPVDSLTMGKNYVVFRPVPPPITWLYGLMIRSRPTKRELIPAHITWNS
ncbi:MAG: hypothetical protein LUE10_00030 [Alistipes sp.]|nr:hypothetical protein [Alistipes sp.]